MAIRMCSKGHVTGYRFCPQCGKESDKQAPPYTRRDPKEKGK